MVLPYWWTVKHKPSGLLDGPEKVKFDHPRRLQKCTRHMANAFSIEYDPSVFEQTQHDETTAVTVMVVTQTDNGEVLRSLKELLPAR